jgi:hypothetical protein
MAGGVSSARARTGLESIVVVSRQSLKDFETGINASSQNRTFNKSGT